MIALRNGFALVMWLALGSTTAIACGYCVEDRIAAVYDYVLLQRTQAVGHQIAFFAWEGSLARNESARTKMLALAEATPGVEKGSTRVSMEPAALAVAFDPRRDSVTAIEAALQKRLGSLKLSVTRLQAQFGP